MQRAGPPPRPARPVRGAKGKAAPGAKGTAARGAKTAPAAAEALVSTPADVWRLAVLAALGAWTIVVPYLGHAISLSVTVPGRKEVVDHVIPGTAALLIAGYLALRAYRDERSTASEVVGGGVCFLAGFWVAATHFTLVLHAVQGHQAWGPALWHASTAIPIVVLALWTVTKDL